MMSEPGVNVSRFVEATFNQRSDSRLCSRTPQGSNECIPLKTSCDPSTRQMKTVFSEAIVSSFFPFVAISRVLLILPRFACASGSFKNAAGIGKPRLWGHLLVVG